MKRRGRPPKTIPPPQSAHQEEQSGSSYAPQEHIHLPVQQTQVLPPPNTPAQQGVLPQAQPQAQQVMSAASVQVQQHPPQQQQIPPQAAVAPGVVGQAEVPTPAGAPVPVVPVVGVDPVMFGQMLQLQTTLLQTLVAREQAPAAPPAPPQEPKAGTIRDFNRFNPPVFSGLEAPEDVDDWLRNIHYLLLASHIPEADMVTAARTKMVKMAGAWIASEMKIRGEVMTWAEFRELFQQKFIPPSSQRRMIQKFVSLTQGDGDVSAYTNQFEILRTYATEILPTEEKRIEWYINGLNNKLKPLVRACDPNTLLAAQQKALQMEQDAGESPDTKSITQKKSAGQFAKAGPSASVRTAKTPFQARPASSIASVTQRPRLPTTCRACGKKGHKAAECWKIHGNCLKCGALDHQIMECPLIENRNVQSSAATQSIPAASRGKAPIVPVARPVPGSGRGSGVTPARASTPVQGRTFVPARSAVSGPVGGGQGRGKRGVYAMASESEPPGEIITDSAASGEDDQQDPDYVPDEDLLPEMEE